MISYIIQPRTSEYDFLERVLLIDHIMYDILFNFSKEICNRVVIF